MMGRIDVAVLYDTFDTPSIDKRTIHTEELFLVGPSGGDGGKAEAERIETIALREIVRYPLVIPGACTRSATWWRRPPPNRGSV